MKKTDSSFREGLVDERDTEKCLLRFWIQIDFPNVTKRPEDDDDKDVVEVEVVNKFF